MLYDIVRFSTQHRALHCYILLSVWIFLLVAGLYKFLEPSQHIKVFNLPHTESMHGYKTGIKTKRIFRSCNKIDDFLIGSEGTVNLPQWNLRGTIIIIRHGDRGPLQHIRNITTINCGSTPNILLNTYQNYVHNMSLNGRMFWMQMGAFHGFPLLPSHPMQCALGQLTMQGISQLLRIGQMMQQAYGKFYKLSNLTSNDIIIHCTRYRRTFQSVMAMLFAMVPSEVWSKVIVNESPSMSFCFSDCACPSAEYFMRLLNDRVNEILRLHPAVGQMVRELSSLVFEQSDDALNSNPLALRDALLSYICHDANLPCVNSKQCLKADQVSALFAYTEWDNHQRWKNSHWRNACLLRAYGMFRNVVSYMLKMASEATPKFVIYSGHDYTLQYLTVPLGISNEHASLQYASRLVFEVYKNEDLSQNGPNGYYFKLLVNGRDVTKEISFCHKPAVYEDGGKKNVFCRVEDIVRFIHDDYFSGLNVTNFKDACFVHKEKTEERFV